MTKPLLRSRAGLGAVALAAVMAAGCATRPANPDDPLERYNRAMFAFNEGVDKAVVKPAAEVYEAALPGPVRTGVGNFFGNIGDLWIGFNNLLQGKVGDGVSDGFRFLVNSTMGLLGVLDVASEAGMVKHDEDFGQTLGYWGVGEGAYFVVPFFGPRTVRDAAVLPIDLYGDSVWGIDDVAWRNRLTGVRIVHTRSTLLGVDKTLEEGTLDRYAYVRDFYLQQRRYKVYDGNPPLEEYEDYNGEETPADQAPGDGAQGTAPDDAAPASEAAGGDASRTAPTRGDPR